MFTNEQSSCNHTKISIICEQEEIQQFDLDNSSGSLSKVFDDIYLTEPILISCLICKLELQFSDIKAQEYIPTPLLDQHGVDVLKHISEPLPDESDGEDCSHEQTNLELYQLIQLILTLKDGLYTIDSIDFGEKEIYLTCDLCSTILYEFFDADLADQNNFSDDDEEVDSSSEDRTLDDSSDDNS